MTTDPTTAYVWNFPVNWADSFRVQKSYRTDIFTSRSRRESRRALMLQPRRTFEFNCIMERGEAREFDALMHKAQDKPFIMPDWSRRALLSADVAATTDVLTFAALPWWLVEGRGIFLFAGNVRPTAVFVESIDGTDVTLTEPLAADWAAGTAVLPACVGMFAGELTAGMPTNTVVTPELTFNVEPGSEPNPAPAAASVTFNGREVCLLRPNWGSGITKTLSWPAEVVDFQRSAVAYFRPFPFPDTMRRAEFLRATPEEMAEVEDLFDRMYGQAGEFYMPTGANDLPSMEEVGPGVLKRWLRVSGTEVYDRYADSRIHKAICVVLRDGTRYYRNVSSITLNGGNSQLNFPLSDPEWPTFIQPSEILMASWMPVWRCASDILSVDWLTDKVAQCEMNMRTLEHLTAET